MKGDFNQMLNLILPILLLAFSQTDEEKIADAIYWSEGGPSARVPYGILSVPVRDHAEARQVCLNTIRNNWHRWGAAGSPGYFIDFLADRYCPPAADPTGNANWKRNVRYFLRNPKTVSDAPEVPHTSGTPEPCC